MDHAAFAPAGGIQELTYEEVDGVAGGIPLVVAAVLAFHGARIAYAAGVAVGAGITTYAVFDD
jgi:hypothetical protein